MLKIEKFTDVCMTGGIMHTPILEKGLFWNVPLPGRYFCSTIFMPPAKSMNII